MGDLLKKLDEIMTSDLVRKLGGLFCLVTIVILAVAFLIGAGSVIKSMKGPIAAVEATEEGGGGEGEGAEEEATDEDYEEEAEDEAEEEAEE